MNAFDQKDVYANLVRIYRQIVGICEVGSDISCYLQLREGILKMEFGC